jgi:hypothetical protein
VPIVDATRADVGETPGVHRGGGTHADMLMVRQAHESTTWSGLGFSTRGPIQSFRSAGGHASVNPGKVSRAF